MPLIRVTCPENSFTAEQEAELAPLLVEAVMVEEVDPVSEACGRGRRGGHTTWECVECGAVVYAPPLSPECRLLAGAAEVRI